MEDALARPAPSRRSRPTALSLPDPARHRLRGAGSTAFETHDVDFFLGPNYPGHRPQRASRGRSTADRAKSACATCGLLGEGPAALLPPDRRRDGRPLPARDRRSSRTASTRSSRRCSTPAATNLAAGDSRLSSTTSPRCGASCSPQRDVVGRLARREFPLINEQIAYRFRDVHDHLVRLTDESMFFQDRSPACSTPTCRRVEPAQQVMKVLTVISTIFMPLTRPHGHVRHERRRCPRFRARRRARSSGWLWRRRSSRCAVSAWRCCCGRVPPAMRVD